MKLQPATAALLCHCSWSLLAYAVRTAGTLPLDLINILTVFDWYSCSWSTNALARLGGCAEAALSCCFEKASNCWLPSLIWLTLAILLVRSAICSSACKRWVGDFAAPVQGLHYFDGLLVFVYIRPSSRRHAVMSCMKILNGRLPLAFLFDIFENNFGGWLN